MVHWRRQRTHSPTLFKGLLTNKFGEERGLLISFSNSVEVGFCFCEWWILVWNLPIGIDAEAWWNFWTQFFSTRRIWFHICQQFLHVSEVDVMVEHNVQIDLRALIANILTAGVNSFMVTIRNVPILIEYLFCFSYAWSRLILVWSVQKRPRLLVVNLVVRVREKFRFLVKWNWVFVLVERYLLEFIQMHAVKATPLLQGMNELLVGELFKLVLTLVKLGDNCLYAQKKLVFI